FWPRDIRHVWEHLGYYLGKRPEPPRFDRYDYAEKMEFWALVWGVIIMAATGLILWFPILAFQYLPKWAIDIAELIHYYEAVLATLAIIVWHFFFVIFHPEEYPMSVTWLNGRMTLHHLKNRHPLEYERTFAPEPRKEESEPREIMDGNQGNSDTES
ncbi:MAG TPA: cytochrome b/b6 domain-containing protein, partial [bacterium]|nr:cytochrome b/b6 domain-containing protein [bacterium]